MKSGIFKTVVESLKEVLTDCNWEFSSKGIRILTTDNSHILLVHLKLDADKFEKYKCDKNLVVGLNMNNLFKIVKTFGNNDSLTVFIDKKEEHYLKLRVESNGKKTEYKLKTLDLNVEQTNIPEVTFMSHISMPSVDFQKLVRDMRMISDKVEIKCVGKQLSFSCSGDFAEQETIIKQSDYNIEDDDLTSIDNDDDSIFQGKYYLEQLVSFTKCTSLCNTINIFMTNDYPLIIRYKVSSLGELKFCLVPISDEHY